MSQKEIDRFVMWLGLWIGGIYGVVWCVGMAMGVR
jgi:hypothetical protein